MVFPRIIIPICWIGYFSKAQSDIHYKYQKVKSGISMDFNCLYRELAFGNAVHYFVNMGIKNQSWNGHPRIRMHGDAFFQDSQ